MDCCSRSGVSSSEDMLYAANSPLTLPISLRLYTAIQNNPKTFFVPVYEGRFLQRKLLASQIVKEPIKPLFD